MVAKSIKYQDYLLNDLFRERIVIEYEFDTKEKRNLLSASQRIIRSTDGRSSTLALSEALFTRLFTVIT